MKRDNCLSWDEYFMGIALLSSLRSKDPNTQVGACIVGKDNRILSLGYNGMPIGCSDDLLPWDNNGDPLDTKYPFVCHAELNAILNSNRQLEGATLYTTLFPCNECAKAIIQSRIHRIVYQTDKYPDSTEVLASKRMFDMAGILYECYKTNNHNITLSL